MVTYHPVSIIDTWASYQDLADLGWTQERIARAKGVGRVIVSYRLNLNKLPDEIKNLVSQGLVKETHLTEILSLSVDLHFSPWLTASQAQLELATWVAKGHTTRETRTRVQKWKEFIEYAQGIYDKLDGAITLYDLTGDEPQAMNPRGSGENTVKTPIVTNSHKRGCDDFSQVKNDIWSVRVLYHAGLGKDIKSHHFHISIRYIETINNISSIVGT